VGVPLGHIQRSKAAWVFYQVLHLPCTPDGIQTHLLFVAIDCTQAPEGVVQTVRLENRGERQRLVVGLCFVEMRQQLAPSVDARFMLADFVQGGVDHRLSYMPPRGGRVDQKSLS
jgi:hypothetical protein